MPILILKLKNNIIKKFDLGIEKSCSIGRREHNDIVLTNLTVSGNHARVNYTADGFILTDLDSKNGTYVNGKQVNTHSLEDGDELLIGKHTLVFEYSEADYAQGLPRDRRPAVEAAVREELAAKVVKKSQGRDRVGVLMYTKGGEGRVVLFKKLTKIGKDTSNDIVVKNFMVAKTAATINKNPMGYAVRFSGGMARLKVNNRIVKESVPLDEYDLISLGGAEFQFYYR